MDTKDKALIGVLGLTAIGMFSLMGIGVYSDTKKEIEFAKAGLVQKVENGEKVWTKP